MECAARAGRAGQRRAGHKRARCHVRSGVYRRMRAHRVPTPGAMILSRRGGAQGALDSGGQAIDAPLYRAFWGLQGAFQAPYAAMEPSRWAATIADVKRVLAAFAQQVPGSFPGGLPSAPGEPGCVARP